MLISHFFYFLNISKRFPIFHSYFHVLDLMNLLNNLDAGSVLCVIVFLCFSMEIICPLHTQLEFIKRFKVSVCPWCGAFLFHPRALISHSDFVIVRCIINHVENWGKGLFNFPGLLRLSSFSISSNNTMLFLGFLPLFLILFFHFYA